ncbi:SDR family NAD(P)-dependent oxidoreductase [Rhizobium sp. NPDC090275]|uniref:SDR family NAD(P)-dependent oxidoreductase n=1 Tax=Rhizobium sp. NPDC090275 TaxID=3364498 RepID=UPI00383A0F3C
MSTKRVAVITGATDGMGRVVAPQLAEAGYHVVVHGRSAERGAEVVDTIKKAGGSAEFMGANLASLADIRRFATELKSRFPKIHLFINNAGIGTGPEDAAREFSDDGLERRFAVNYLSVYLLTRLVQDSVIAAAPSRIVNVASDGQQAIDFSNVQLERDYSGEAAYCRSKVAEIMFTLDLSEELKGKGVTVNTMHPSSFMDTTMVRQMKHAVVESIDVGAGHLADLALNPKFDGVTGRYLNRGVDMPANEQCYDLAARKKLRDLSVELTGI